ncbi:hypothetical protein LCGC14_0383510 [marine sediment metagenome]|uniref:ERCC4 domain-containing protein n=1 Tax=marine sediment metagenome TaxID=412755 RepID=A0A0F9TJU6_9ZZZZ
MTIFVDTFEPVQIEELIAQSVPTIRITLNHSSQGIADYFWYAVDGHRIQVERKQIDEILSGMDSVEEQLRRELGNGIEETILLYEGTCEPIPGLKSAIQSWKLAKAGKVMVPSHKYNASYSGLHAWLSQLDKAGITIIHTCHYIGTAMCLVALYNNSQKQEHVTLRRYIKEHITIKPYNEHVITLMGIKGANIGEEIGLALIDRFGTVWYTLSQDEDTLAETIIGGKTLGINRAKRILRSIGRTT